MVVIVACGLWLAYYTVDSQHQKQTYETVAKDFLLEKPKSSLSLTEEDSPEEPPTTQESVVTLTTRRPAMTWLPCKQKIPTAWDGSPFRTPP